jgi:hypothetical protein
MIEQTDTPSSDGEETEPNTLKCQEEKPYIAQQSRNVLDHDK